MGVIVNLTDYHFYKQEVALRITRLYSLAAGNLLLFGNSLSLYESLRS